MHFEKELEPFIRFSKLFTKAPDPEMMIVLRGHLLLEEELRALLDTKFPRSEFLENARLTTHQAICLAEAFFRPQAEPWLWDVLHKVNKLRNDISHKLQPKDVAKRMREISDAVKAEIYPTTGFGTDHPLVQFYLSVVIVFAALKGLPSLPAGQSIRGYLTEQGYYQTERQLPNFIKKMRSELTRKRTRRKTRRIPKTFHGEAKPWKMQSR